MSIRSNSPFDDPLIDPRFLTTDFDIAATREAVKKLIEFAGAPVWKDVLTGPLSPLTNATTDPELEEYVRNGVGAGNHLVGTSSMSPRNANWGVVDPDLLVKKTSGLRIVHASILVRISPSPSETSKAEN